LPSPFPALRLGSASNCTLDISCCCYFRSGAFFPTDPSRIPFYTRRLSVSLTKLPSFSMLGQPISTWLCPFDSFPFPVAHYPLSPLRKYSTNRERIRAVCSAKSSLPTTPFLFSVISSLSPPNFLPPQSLRSRSASEPFFQHHPRAPVHASSRSALMCWDNQRGHYLLLYSPFYQRGISSFFFYGPSFSLFPHLKTSDGLNALSSTPPYPQAVPRAYILEETSEVVHGLYPHPPPDTPPQEFPPALSPSPPRQFPSLVLFNAVPKSTLHLPSFVPPFLFGIQFFWPPLLPPFPGRSLSDPDPALFLGQSKIFFLCSFFGHAFFSRYL